MSDPIEGGQGPMAGYTVRERRHNGELRELDIVDQDGRLADRCHPHLRPEQRAQAEEMARALLVVPEGYMLQYRDRPQPWRGDADTVGWRIGTCNGAVESWMSEGHATAANAIAAIADHTPVPWTPPPPDPNACWCCGLQLRQGWCEACGWV